MEGMTDLAEPEVEGTDLDLHSPPSFRAYGVALVVLGAIGLAASFTLLVDKIKLLQDPNFTPSCDINPVLS